MVFQSLRMAANLSHHLLEETGTGPAAVGPMTSVSLSPFGSDLKKPGEKSQILPNFHSDCCHS